MGGRMVMKHHFISAWKLFLLCCAAAWLTTAVVRAEDRANRDDHLPASAQPSLAPDASHVSDFDARLQLARLLSYQPGQLAGAVREYQLLLRQQPENPVVRLELARVLMQLKRYAEASAQLEAILRLTPGDLEALALMAQIALYSGDYGKAVQLFERLDRQKLDGKVLLQLAQAYTWNKQYDQAIATYQKALALTPKPSAAVLADLGDVYLYSANLPAAVEWYRKALRVDPKADPVRKKLALALSWENQNTEALALLQSLQRKRPEDKEVALELIRVYAKTDKAREAGALAKDYVARFPDEVDFILEAAALEARAGHAKRASELFLRARRLSSEPHQTDLLHAANMNVWGDFHRIESIYREQLANNPNDVQVQLKLAGVLVSAQNYHRAEGIYRRLLLEGEEVDNALLGLAELKLREKDFNEALQLADQLLAGFAEKAKKTAEVDEPGEHQALPARALTLKGEILLRRGDYDGALKAYMQLSRIPATEARGLLGMGRVYLAQKDAKEAAKYFARAHALDSKNIEIRYYFAGEDKVLSERFRNRLLQSDQNSAMDLIRWAELYTLDGHYQEAIEIYSAALKRDPECFPAALGLAETLAIDHQYPQALERLQHLAEQHPGNSKVWITYARVLGWSKNYDESLEAYAKIHQNNRADATPRIEAARTAFWGKDADKATELYSDLWSFPVDRQLAEQLRPLVASSPAGKFPEAFARLRQTAAGGSIYEGYEAFAAGLPLLKAEVSPAVFAELQKQVIDLQPEYRIQKSAYLENRAKQLAWDKRFSRSLDSYRELIRFQPGNQEALFDAAQVECALGLCDREAATYQQLLTIDPRHSRAGMALERQRIRSHPSFAVDYSFWNEQGRGGLSQIARQQVNLGLKTPLGCRYSFSLNALNWFEDPKMDGLHYYAYGGGLGFEGVINEYLKGAVSYTRKDYTDNELEDTNTGFARLWINARDYFQVGLGYDRSDELYNEFSIQQGTQANSWWLEASSFLSRRLEVTFRARYTDYTDDNRGQSYYLSGGYALTDHPRVLKFSLKGEYRNTQKESIYEYVDGELINIIHPYWTPQDYFGGAATLEWYHDLSKFLFCGSELHFYALRISPAYDTESNPGVNLEGEWHYEFKDHWMATLKGLVYESKLWDAYGVWASLRYQF
jgi:tetratricopeptide (TPR) repeat protein